MSGIATTKHAPARWMGYGACALAGGLWGTGFYFGRLALNEMSVEYMVLYRFLFAMLGMLPVLLRNRVRFSPAELRMLLISAALGIPVQFLLQFHGLVHTTVSHASLMVGSMPVLLAVGASIFAGERLDWPGWLALAGSTVGAGLVVLGGAHSGGGNAGAGHETPTLSGDLLVVASLVTALGWILLSKKLMARHSPPVVTAYTILAGTVMLAIWILTPVVVKPWIPNTSAPMPFAHLSATAWIALAVSGLACTATTTLLWNWGIHHVPASRAGVFLNIEPALGSLLGVELLGEHLGPYAWLGGALILGAAVTMTIRGHDPEVVLE
ncbi:DMT family transporter [Terracidiphilus gabretensis]|uniref:DMT family transporter n=1 Tax=Terracidiphilus gabretensis TaxID=1577687 RepID=UPI001E341865|nr:EamA family transporter [Terracidiphilus gabretensis]